MARNPYFSRRRFLTGAATLATAVELQNMARALGLAQNLVPCSLTPEQEEGPYYVVEKLLRSDIRESRPGLPLALQLIILNARTCKPLPNAVVDVWHCDALGVYSGFTKQQRFGPGGRGGFGGPPPGPPPSAWDMQGPGDMHGPPENMGPPPMSHPSDKLTFFRGTQVTDPNGAVSFQTIFPGFYEGRTNHIHFKVRIGESADPKGYGAGHVSHTGQVFFPEDLAVQLMQHEPYTGHHAHRTTQREDHVFGDQQGDQSLARLEGSPAGDPQKGLRAALIAVVDPLALPAGARRRGGPPA